MRKDRYGRPIIQGSVRPEVLKVELVSTPDDNAESVLSNKSSLKFEEQHPDTLVIQCSDGRYTEIVANLMVSAGIARYDVMAMPGGPALLDMASASILQSEACKAGTGFLIKGHGIKRIWLLAHEGCGYYKYNLNGMPSDIIMDRQASDMQRAANWLRTLDPTLTITAMYIAHQKEMASFKQIPLE